MFALASFTLLAAYLFSIYLGYWVAKKDKRLIFIFCLFFVILIAASVTFNRNAKVEYSLFNSEFYGHIKIWWGYAPLFFCAGLIFQVSKNDFLRKFIVLFCLAVTVQLLYTRFLFPVIDIKYSDNKPDKNGYCFQSTHYSCGAAVACTLLSQLKVKTDEDEMIKMCNTNVFTGTNEFLLRSCLNAKLKKEKISARYKVHYLPFEKLKTVSYPLLAVVKLHTIMDHWIVILEYKDDKIKVFDPLVGDSYYKEEALKEKWRSRTIVLSNN